MIHKPQGFHAKQSHKLPLSFVPHLNMADPVPSSEPLYSIKMA